MIVAAGHTMRVYLKMKAKLLLQVPVSAVLVLLAGACGEVSSNADKAGEGDGIPRIAPQEMNQRLGDGEQIMIVDTRSSSSFEAGHIANAVSIPANETVQRLDEFPDDRAIVFYCT
jgi:predicted sulfurtransferase